MAPELVEPSELQVPLVTAHAVEVTESLTPLVPPPPPPPDGVPSQPSGGGPMSGPHEVPCPEQSCSVLLCIVGSDAQGVS